MVKLTLLLLLAAVTAFPQKLSFGLKAGVPLTDVVKSESWKGVKYHPASGRYRIGPVLELHLSPRLSVELDALYRSVEYRRDSALASGSAWEFPLLLKGRLSGGFVAPYLAGGVTFNRLRGLAQLGELSDASVTGYVFSLGLEGHLPIVCISPELRYTKWRSENLRNAGGGFILSNQNQFEALVGITF